MPFSWIGRTAVDAASRGVPVFEMLAKAGLAGGVPLSDDTGVDSAEFHLMCNVLITSIDDELHGAGRRRMVRGTGALGLQLMASARNLRAAITSLARFHRMAGEFCDLELIEHDTEAEIRIHSNLPPGPMSFVVEEIMANWLFVQICFVLQRPVKLSSFHGAPTHPQVGARHAYLDCLMVGARCTALRFPKAYLELAPRARILDNPILDAVLYWLQQASETASFHVAHLKDRPVSGSILELLTARDLDFEQCCEALSDAPKQVRSALVEEGGSFRQLRRVALVTPGLIYPAQALFGLIPTADPRRVRATVGYNDLKVTTLNANLVQPVGDLTFTATANYRRGEQHFLSDCDGTQAEACRYIGDTFRHLERDPLRGVEGLVLIKGAIEAEPCSELRRRLVGSGKARDLLIVDRRSPSHRRRSDL